VRLRCLQGLRGTRLGWSPRDGVYLLFSMKIHFILFFFGGGKRGEEKS
jgi:hypothetical protein